MDLVLRVLMPVEQIAFTLRIDWEMEIIGSSRTFSNYLQVWYHNPEDQNQYFTAVENSDLVFMILHISLALMSIYYGYRCNATKLIKEYSYHTAQNLILFDDESD
jgi:hypothetical protein